MIKHDTIEWLIWQIDAINATIEQSAILYGITSKEREAFERLKIARLNLLEEIESREVKPPAH